MYLSDAIRKRINFYLEKHNNMSLYGLFKLTGIPLQTLSSFMKGKTELLQLDTLLHICEGFRITLGEFFQDGIFDEVEQEHD